MVMSGGDWSFGDGWIAIGLALWAGVAVVAELALWPAERRLQEAVADPASAMGEVGAAGPAGTEGGTPAGPGLRSACLRVVGLSAALGAVLVVAAVVMVAKPA